MYKVKIHMNWFADDELCELFSRCAPNHDYRWKDLVLTSGDDHDFLVIINHGIDYPHDPLRTLYFWAEPSFSRERYRDEGWDPDPKDYLYWGNEHWLDKWGISLNYKQLQEPIYKDKVLSTVSSGLAVLPAYRARRAFNYLLHCLPYFDHYGRKPHGFNELEKYRGTLERKEEGLLAYKYHFNTENAVESGYYTERFVDAILCECLIFYYGCPDIERWVDPECFIPLDLTKLEESLTIVEKAIADNEWEKRLPAIREQKRKFMEELNPLNIIWKAIENHA